MKYNRYLFSVLCGLDHKDWSAMERTGEIITAMIHYYEGDPKRINHFIKVYGFAKAIGERESLSEEEQLILEIAALTHDIGIRNSERQYHSSAGNYQQIVGPPEARKLLKEKSVPEHIIERVCWLIAHHHTYSEIKGMDYQILVEADFLVNAFEDMLGEKEIRHFEEKIMKTVAGKEFLDKIYFGRSVYEKNN